MVDDTFTSDLGTVGFVDAPPHAVSPGIDIVMSNHSKRMIRIYSKLLSQRMRGVAHTFQDA
jgi:hypothetical protein